MSSMRSSKALGAFAVGGWAPLNRVGDIVGASFLVPKYRLNEAGEPGGVNDVRVAGDDPFGHVKRTV